MTKLLEAPAETSPPETATQDVYLAWLAKGALIWIADGDTLSAAGATFNWMVGEGNAPAANRLLDGLRAGGITPQDARRILDEGWVTVQARADEPVLTPPPNPARPPKGGKR